MFTYKFVQITNIFFRFLVFITILGFNFTFNQIHNLLVVRFDNFTYLEKIRIFCVLPIEVIILFTTLLIFFDRYVFLNNCIIVIVFTITSHIKNQKTHLKLKCLRYKK